MFNIYGSMLCKDCVECRTQFDAQGIPYEFHDFGEELTALKEFLALRDREEIFDTVREAGKIGIPCLVCEDGRVSLDWEEFLPEKTM